MHIKHLRILRKKPHSTWKLSENCWVWTGCINLLQTRAAWKIDYIYLPIVLYLTIQWFAWGSGASWQWIYKLRSQRHMNNYKAYGSGARITWIQKSQERIHPTWAKERFNLARFHNRAWGSYGKRNSKNKCIVCVLETSQKQPSE